MSSIAPSSPENTYDRLMEKAKRNDACLSGEHEEDFDITVTVRPVGSYIYIEDKKTRKETPLRTCKHCRAIYLEKP